MPEIIACPQCKGKLKLPEALLGKKVRCPDCKNTFVAGASAPVAAPPPLPQFKQGVAAPPIRKPAPPPAEVLEIDADDLIVEEEAPRSRGSSGNHRRREEVTDAPRPRTRRDDYDDEYDRPRRRKRPREDDYYDDDEDLDPQEAKRKAKEERAAWRTADIGVLLHGIANWLCVGAGGLALLTLFIGFVMLATKSPPGLGMARFTAVLQMIGFVLWGINLILADIGYGFWIVAPSRHGAKGLAIGCMVVGSLIPIFILVIIFTGASAVDSGLQGQVGGFGTTLAGLGVMAIITAILEVSRLTLFPLFLWAGGKAMRDKSFTSSAVQLAIVTPSVLVGTILFAWLLNAIVPLGHATPWIILFTAMMVVGTWLAIVLWGAITCGNARRVLP
jgi:hypothetical protein